MMAPAGLTWLIILFLGFYTLRMLPFINLELAVRFQFWLLDLLKWLERKIDELEKDDD